MVLDLPSVISAVVGTSTGSPKTLKLFTAIAIMITAAPDQERSGSGLLTGQRALHEEAPIARGSVSLIRFNANVFPSRDRKEAIPGLFRACWKKDVPETFRSHLSLRRRPMPRTSRRKHACARGQPSPRCGREQDGMSYEEISRAFRIFGNLSKGHDPQGARSVRRRAVSYPAADRWAGRRETGRFFRASSAD